MLVIYGKFSVWNRRVIETWKVFIVEAIALCLWLGGQICKQLSIANERNIARRAYLWRTYWSWTSVTQAVPATGIFRWTLSLESQQAAVRKEQANYALPIIGWRWFNNKQQSFSAKRHIAIWDETPHHFAKKACGYGANH